MKNTKKYIKTKLSASENGKDFMRDMSRGTGKRRDKKKHANKYACRHKINYNQY